ncbi:phosphonopyruvate hydrolase [Stella sp.]|uniref:phosphonopyruvate hydrolase n=1 Tax=Stella sp. TaxID=2912054 RepID=UPI0035B3E608
MSKRATFRARLAQKPLTAIIGCHNPLGARLAAEAGFDGIWASGFELSAAMGVPDASIVTMTQHLEIARAMDQATSVPVVADIDTGFGNATNVIHATRQYEAAGVAALVIEDKTFPKDTSLLAGGRQELVRVAEFEGKIAAACATRRDPDLLVVARTEALIAGLGQEEALMRARAYEKAGADAILIHSKQKTPDEIVAFVDAWDGGVPLVLVPTAYPDLTEERIRALGKVRLVIYGNHGVRAITQALTDTFRRIRADGGALGVEATIAPTERVFAVQGVPEMKREEERFLR